MGLIPTFIAYWLSVKRARKEQFSSYFLSLYGIVSKMITRVHAGNLNDRFKALMNARIEGEMRKSAMEKLGIDPSSVVENAGPSFAADFLFLLSFGDVIETVKECRNYESVFSEMEKKGILPSLRLRDEKLHSYLFWVHNSAQTIVEQTKDIALETRTEKDDKKESEASIESQDFQNLMGLSTEYLFRYAKLLEKRLRKYV